MEVILSLILILFVGVFSVSAVLLNLKTFNLIIENITSSRKNIEEQFNKLYQYLKEINRIEVKNPIKSNDLKIQYDKLTIDNLNLSPRTKNILLKQNIKTLEQLLSYKEIELLKIRNIGLNTLKEIKKCIEFFGLKFKEE